MAICILILSIICYTKMTYITSIYAMNVTDNKCENIVLLKTFCQFICDNEHTYFDVTIAILDIIHSPVFHLKHDILETVFCLRLQVGLTE
jgi:hypothetical protein